MVMCRYWFRTLAHNESYEGSIPSITTKFFGGHIMSKKSNPVAKYSRRFNRATVQECRRSRYKRGYCKHRKDINSL